MTIAWHVDDLKISHVDPEAIEACIDWLSALCSDEEIGVMKPKRGRAHDFLGMILDYSVEGELHIKMDSYVESMINNFPNPELLKKKAATPAGDHLFEVNPEALKLLEDEARIFHTIVAQGLFICKRARPDIMTAIAFLCTRVKDPDIDDWKKLIRLLCYLNSTKNYFLRLSADSMNMVSWEVDAAFAVHEDMKSHTGAVGSLGRGAFSATSTKQKLNTKSSTEAELVGVDDVSHIIFWVRNFMNEQGYPITENVIYQDNQSAMLLEKNGYKSVGKRSRHINIRYFFIKDRVERGEATIEYRPTDEMTADFFTKPLQGQKFKKFRDRILGMESDSQDQSSGRSVLDVHGKAGMKIPARHQVF